MTLTKQGVLRLYRRCLKSANQIPDLHQRATYLNYVKDGFRRKARLPPYSREAISSYRGGIEQVTDMEYYQRMAKAKHEIRDNKFDVQQALTSADTVLTQPREHGNDEIQPHASHSDVYNWLTSHLPYLRREDAMRYCECLFNDGFDSVAFIEEELLEDDLDFMKRAHRRVIIRHLENQRNETR